MIKYFTTSIGRLRLLGFLEEAIVFLIRNNKSFIQFFSPRKPNGTWSKVNKEKIKQLIDKGLMTQAGFESIEKAKQNGSWTILDETVKQY